MKFTKYSRILCGLSIFLVLSIVSVFFQSPVFAAGPYEITAAYPNLGTTYAYTFQLNGNASVQGGDHIRLTQDAGTLWGSAFRLNKISMPSNFAFNTFFTFKMISTGSSERADGIVFVIQGTTNTAGGTGQDLGFTGINPGFGIEFDTYQNTVYGDPDNNHVAIITNGSADHTQAGNPTPVSINPSVVNLADTTGTLHYCWIDYDRPSRGYRRYQRR